MTETTLTPVVCTVEIAAPRERVFELLTTPDFDPPGALGFTWVRGVTPDVVTQVDVELTETEEGGTRVELRHTGWEQVPDDQAVEWRGLHEDGWRHFLGCLRELAEGRPVDKTRRG